MNPAAMSALAVFGGASVGALSGSQQLCPTTANAAQFRQCPRFFRHCLKNLLTRN